MPKIISPKTYGMRTPKSKQSKLNVAIIGLGEHMVRAHVKHLLRDKRVEITHYYDPNPKLNLESIFKNTLPIRIENLEDLYRNTTIDTVFIGSPDEFHIPQLVSCIRNVKNVFCEKPVGITEPEIKTLKKVMNSEVRSLIISSCHPRRFDPPITWLKKKLENSKWVAKHLGDIKHFSFDFWYHEVTEGWKKDRSLLLDHFGHEIDLMRFLFNSNKKKEVSAKCIFDSYDKYKVTGTVRDIEFAFTGYRKDSKFVYNESIRIDGTKGAIAINLNTGKTFFANTGKTITIPKIDYDHRFKMVTNNFIDAIINKTPVYLTHKDILINNLVGVAIKKHGSFN